MSHLIQVLHVAGCPGAPEAVAVARSVAGGRDDVEVRDILIEDEAQALARGMRGSPTVLVDGRDVEDAPATPPGTMG